LEEEDIHYPSFNEGYHLLKVGLTYLFVTLSLSKGLELCPAFIVSIAMTTKVVWSFIFDTYIYG